MTSAVVIGAGPHGLAAAILLARAGRSVTLLERRERPGGLARLANGPVKVGRDAFHRLGLAAHGLSLAEWAEPVFLAEPDGRGLVLHDDPQLATEAIAARSGRDAERYVAWRAWIRRVSGFLRQVLESPPPDPFSGTRGDRLELVRRAFDLRRLGSDDMLELLRTAPMCAADWLGEWFEDPLLTGGLAARASRASVNGPWAPHTAALLLMRECAGLGVVESPAALAEALLRAAEAAGVSIRLGTAAEEILVERGAVRGVRLGDGETLETGQVVSAADPRTTLLGLVHPRHLEPRLVHELDAFRARGTTAFVRLELEAPLTFRARPGETFARAALTGGVDDLEHAFDPVKYGELAARPWLDLRCEGTTVSIEAHCAPYELAGGWTSERRAALGEAVLARLSEVAELPGAAASEVLSPADVEERFGTHGGHVLHGEPALDQLLFMRPAAACARYETPIEGLRLCGPGTHPAGFAALSSAVNAVAGV